MINNFHDIHIHTTLSSCCKDPLSLPDNILKQATQYGIKTIGFSDHMWDRACPGPSEWYAPQNEERVLALKEQVQQHYGIRVLFGCETEYCGNGKVGISRETAEKLDFVLIPTSHVHMVGFVCPPEDDHPRGIAKLMVKHFKEVVQLGLATAIAHPFMPVKHGREVDLILPFITDEDFRECFTLAALNGVSLEITTGYFPTIRGEVFEHFTDDSFKNMLRIAKACGATFTLGSDAHTLSKIGAVLRLEPFLEELGISEKDFCPKLF